MMNYDDNCRMTPTAFARAFRLGFDGATWHRTCVNCAHCGYVSHFGFSCQHPFVRQVPRPNGNGESDDKPLRVLEGPRDTVCDAFEAMAQEGAPRVRPEDFNADRFRAER